jgi:3-mercaptopyruvate sulfurtransferase SseA
VNAVADGATDLPHMLPPEGAFSAAADALGIGRDTQVPISGIILLQESQQRSMCIVHAPGHFRAHDLDKSGTVA